MRKGIILSCVLFLLCGCALLPRRATEIVWPGKVDRMEALCDIDVAWKDMNYSGSMSVSLDYPSKFRLEVYGPFGDTIVFMSKEGEKFVLVAGEERFTDEKAFEEKFDIRLRDFIDDIAVRGEGEAGIQGSGGDGSQGPLPGSLQPRRQNKQHLLGRAGRKDLRAVPRSPFQ